MFYTANEFEKSLTGLLEVILSGSKNIDEWSAGRSDTDLFDLLEYATSHNLILGVTYKLDIPDNLFVNLKFARLSYEGLLALEQFRTV